MILVLDNYDSFVHNVARLLRLCGGRVEVVRSDALTVEEALRLRPTHVVLSPGPGTPAGAGISVPLVRVVEGRVPVLGICLGHQAVAAAYGAPIRRSPVPVHGRATPVRHHRRGLLKDVPSPFLAGRYHSLAVPAAELPAELAVAAWTEEGEVMAIRHRRFPTWGIQFHPESVLTEEGEAILRAFLALAPSGRRAVGSA
jgi:anthranilate synthase/aminodeoxychorismate synthase-like glutamine amidotransferase